MKVVSGKELGRTLERHGWQLQRIQGSHHIYSKTGLRASRTQELGKGSDDLDE